MMEEKKRLLMDFLLGKNIEVETVKKAVDYQEFNPTFDFLKNAEFIYEIFSFINLNDMEIEKLITKKISLLKEPKEEICKIAYVFKEANLGSFIFDFNSVLAKVKCYKRTFMRHMICKDIGLAPTALMVEEKKAFNEHRLSEIIHSAHNVWIDNDEEIENYLNKRLTYNNTPIDVDTYIELNAKLLYSNYLKSKRTNKNSKGTK